MWSRWLQLWSFSLTESWWVVVVASEGEFVVRDVVVLAVAVAVDVVVVVRCEDDAMFA